MKTVIFSDLDSTFLDTDTYSIKNNGLLVAKLVSKGYYVIFATSKTFRETRFYIMQTGINMPFITENGGALYIPERFPDSAMEIPPASKSAYSRIVFGTPVKKSEDILTSFASKHKLDIKILHKMSKEEVSSLTGLPSYLAAFSIMREFDLTFTLPGVQEEILPALSKELEPEDLILQKGGRFWHITGRTNKYRAAEHFLKTMKEDPLKIIALGDSENDFELLESADIPIVIPSKKNGPCKLLTDKLSNPIISPLPAPEGWEQAIIKLLNMEET